MKNTKMELTIIQGLEIQQRHLTQWKSVLMPEVYEHLAQYCRDCNGKLDYNKDDGYKVVRGTSLDNVVFNYMLGHRYENGFLKLNQK